MQTAIAKVPSLESSALLRYFKKFEPLAEKYARQIFDSYKISLEFEDLKQEFLLKIYTSIIGYAHYYEKRKQQNYEPWPIHMYLQKALVNKKKDFIRLIQESPNKILSVEHHAFDYAVYHTMESSVTLNQKEVRCEINGIDLLEGLDNNEARCFMLYLKGYSIGKLVKLFKRKVPEVPAMIQRRCQYLRQYQNILLEDTCTQYAQFSLENEN